MKNLKPRINFRWNYMHLNFIINNFWKFVYHKFNRSTISTFSFIFSFFLLVDLFYISLIFLLFDLFYNSKLWIVNGWLTIFGDFAVILLFMLGVIWCICKLLGDLRFFSVYIKTF
jgi:hypothetical protein